MIRSVLEVIVFVLVVVADAVGLVPLTQTIVLLPLVWVALRVGREPWASIGFQRPEHLGRMIAIGIVAGVALEALAVLVTTPWISGLFGVQPDYSELREIRGNLPMLLLFLALSWTLAAFGEEICFRGFLMKRLARLFGESRAAWWVSLLLSSVLFGWGHTEQGVSGWVQEGLSGFLLGVLFLTSGRNLVVPIVAHGVSNTVAFVLIYLGRYPGLG
ncbi:MAG: CPBP family intramembrane metalloprotease [Candidatus Eisenbacteria bacterium]|uniref:CPBP family intramembrane metalloprotease n=1 Tax=Eiseniibacteriota bacterium TaxID=2212470 RepID=A0A849SPV2_UNCEI|nr:CPBP family intramembrane metalloprotease [Candidatus Eisenbacteria bacterium]